MFIVEIGQLKKGYPPELKLSQLIALKFNVVKLLQYSKASSPIDVTLLGIVTEVKSLQRLKAEFPIDVTPLGIVMEVKPLQ